MRTLNQEQLQALIRYAKRSGRKWKSRLRRDWKGE
jgi:hypothetical protein